VGLCDVWPLARPGARTGAHRVPVLGDSQLLTVKTRSRTITLCLFETQVLCGVSGSWSLCKNGLQMAVAKNTDHAYYSVTYSLLHGQATTTVGEGFFAAWRAVACSSYRDQNSALSANFLCWQSTRLLFKHACKHVQSFVVCVAIVVVGVVLLVCCLCWWCCCCWW
jgi:hypothetical protein